MRFNQPNVVNSAMTNNASTLPLGNGRLFRPYQLRRSGIFVEPMSRESLFEPQRGGMEVTGTDAAPTELSPAVQSAWCYKDIAPTELI